MTVKNYFYGQFPGELAKFASPRQPAHHCEHCKAPRKRRCLIESRKDLAGMSSSFRLSWYGITLIDQALFTYDRTASAQWVSKTGGYPLPVQASGSGCVVVMAPAKLLVGNVQSGEWLDFFLAELREKLKDFTGVTPTALASHLERDNAFGKHPLEARLLSNLKAS